MSTSRLSGVAGYTKCIDALQRLQRKTTSHLELTSTSTFNHVTNININIYLVRLVLYSLRLELQGILYSGTYLLEGECDMSEYYGCAAWPCQNVWLFADNLPSMLCTTHLID